LTSGTNEEKQRHMPKLSAAIQEPLRDFGLSKK
jgi:hypothetical protein